jgi:hypothetical protein
MPIAVPLCVVHGCAPVQEPSCQHTSSKGAQDNCRGQLRQEACGQQYIMGHNEPCGTSPRNSADPTLRH